MAMNPYGMQLVDQIDALRRAYAETFFSMFKEPEPTPSDLQHLERMAPSWPKGEHAYRGFRIRFGEGSEGVASTFERHVARIKSVFGEKYFVRWNSLLSGSTSYQGKQVERLRLLNGNETHKPVIEWIVADLDTNRKRDSVTAVRNEKSLADELLVITWMFPEMIRAIDHNKRPGLFAAGYEEGSGTTPTPEGLAVFHRPSYTTPEPQEDDGRTQGPPYR